jgi:peptidoglycan/LPS O-acetylase OafA/YrhL
MIRDVGQFSYNVISGTAAHLIFMIAGFILTAILLGKIDEGVVHLVVAVVLPYFGAGTFIAYRDLRWARTVSVISGALALAVPPIAIAAYRDWNWATLGTEYWFAAIAIPFSLLGCIWQQNNEQSKAKSESSSEKETIAR